MSRFAPLLAALLGGCDGDPALPDDPSGEDAPTSMGDAAPPLDVEPEDAPQREPVDPCEDACDDLGTGASVATCHSCRCKVAFDGWLPSQAQLQCGNAEPIVTYHAEVGDEGVTLEPAAPAATKCVNPSLLTGSCRQGSRLGHLVHGDVSLYWICRDPYLDYDASVLFEDMAIVGHNLRSGATCFWDDVNDVMHGDDAPALDLEHASEEERASFAEHFSYTDGSGCVSCHDHDPFVYTPYLHSTTWDSTAGDHGPYHLVALGPEPRSTGTSHLVSPEAAACTSCHRLGDRDTCSFFAPNALGRAKTLSHEPEVHAAAEPGSPHWPLAYWMPPSATGDFDAWAQTFAEAAEHVLRCCEAPGENTGDCEWAPVPALAGD